jgi:hypothetical protein
VHQADGIIWDFAPVVMDTLNQRTCTISDTNDCYFDFAHSELFYLRSYDMIKSVINGNLFAPPG